jgi:hypothetical protein
MIDVGIPRQLALIPPTALPRTTQTFANMHSFLLLSEQQPYAIIAK